MLKCWTDLELGHMPRNDLLWITNQRQLGIFYILRNVLFKWINSVYKGTRTDCGFYNIDINHCWLLLSSGNPSWSPPHGFKRDLLCVKWVSTASTIAAKSLPKNDSKYNPVVNSKSVDPGKFTFHPRPSHCQCLEYKVVGSSNSNGWVIIFVYCPNTQQTRNRDSCIVACPCCIGWYVNYMNFSVHQRVVCCWWQWSNRGTWRVFGLAGGC